MFISGGHSLPHPVVKGHERCDLRLTQWHTRRDRAARLRRVAASTAGVVAASAAFVADLTARATSRPGTARAARGPTARGRAARVPTAGGHAARAATASYAAAATCVAAARSRQTAGGTARSSAAGIIAGATGGGRRGSGRRRLAPRVRVAERQGRLGVDAAATRRFAGHPAREGAGKAERDGEPTAQGTTPAMRSLQHERQAMKEPCPSHSDYRSFVGPESRC
jgi:hypothetical protein